MKKSRHLWLAAFAAFSALSQASLVSSTGAGIIVAAPASAVLGAYESNTQVRGWDELQDVALSAVLTGDAKDPGTYNATGDLGSHTLSVGTRVSSHYLHQDTVGGATHTFEGSFTFSHDILLVMCRGDDTNPKRLDDSDFLSSGTTYGNGETLRGYELSSTENFTISADRRTIRFRATSNTATDCLRVITAVPEPGTLAVLGLGAIALMRRRKA